MDFSTLAWISSRSAARLTSVLTDFLWQGAAIGLAAALLLRLLRHARPETRHAVCALGMLAMAAAPVVTWMAEKPSAAPVMPSALTEVADGAVTGFTEPAASDDGRGAALRQPASAGWKKLSAQPAAAVLENRRWAVFAAVAWVSGVVLLGLWRLAGWRRIVTLRASSLPAPDDVLRRVADLARRMGVRGAPVVRLTRRLMSPAVTGVWRPIILLPVAVLSGLSTRELDAILAHELAHIRRRDFLLNALQCAVETLLFYHPAVWWLSRRMRLERELCCDDAAAALTADRAGCARALARLAELRCASLPVPAPAAAGGPLARRIRRLLAENGAPSAAPGAPMAGPLTAAALLALALPAGNATAQSAAPSMRGEILDRRGLVLARSVPAELSHQNRTVHQRREYPYRALAGHALGYTKIDPASDALTGVQGLEKTLDQELNAPDGGARLTLDARLQRIVSDAFHEAGATRGSAVLMDPRNGDTLAMASFPDLDIGLFSPVISVEDWTALNQDPATPLINRAMSGMAPGSTFKLITALAADSAGLGDSEYLCTGFVNYGRGFPCWTVQKGLGGHGNIRLPEALMRSCNCYFYQLGNAAGPDRIAAVAQMFGIDDTTETGPFVHGRSDFMPTQKWWMTKNSGPWTEAKTANISIGQGEVLATPLQMTSVAAAIGNGGTVWRPRIVSHVRVNGVWTERPAVRRGHLTDLGSTPEGIAALQKDVRMIAAIQQGMRDTVNKPGGTARQAMLERFPIAGKTGTSQMWRHDQVTKKRQKDNHTWFVGYVPADAPRYAVAVVVANGHAGGAVSAPIARRILVRAVAAETAEPAEPQPLTPVKGGFGFLDQVRYAGED